MSYDLEIFHGDPAAAEETFRPLDCRLAWRVLEEMLAQERVERDRDELVWFLPTRTVNIFVGQAGETVQSMAASMLWGDRSLPLADLAQAEVNSPAWLERQKADMTRVFILLQTLAEQLGAQIYDPQREDFLPRAAISAFVEGFDHEAEMRMAMDPEGGQAAFRTDDRMEDAMKARRAITFSPWTVVIALFALGFIGVKMVDRGEMKRADHVPVMQVLNDYQPASRRNAVPRAEIWVDPNYVLRRSVLKNGEGVRGLVWVIRADGKLLQERPADDEMALQMRSLRQGVTYSVQLKLYDGSYGGEGRAVSDLVTFRAPPAQ